MSQKYFDKYEENFNEEASCCGKLCNCCTDCCGKILKHVTKQVWKLAVFLTIIGLCVAGIYWGATEIKSLNDFSEISGGCTVVGVDQANVTCHECNCNYYYNPFEFDKKRVCDSCPNSVKTSYLVTAEHCGTQVLRVDNDYWNDKACGVSEKVVNQSYNCFLYKDCRGQYSFDTMYADQSELVYPIIIICVCSALIILTCVLRCLCC